MTLAYYLGAYVLAWLAAQVASFLAFVRTCFAIFAPADVAEFLTRPYVFSGLCLVLVAIIANGTKLLMWWVNNRMKQRIRELERRVRQPAAAERVSL